MPVEIFCCYSREDQPLLLELKKHLTPLQRQGLINIWHDTNISPGSNWHEEINEHLNSAQIILLLISPDFLASDYCYSVEMKLALDRHERGEARVVPILLSPALWKDTPLGKLQVLPKNARPVTRWRNRQEALFNVAQGIGALMAPALEREANPRVTSTANINQEFARTWIVDSYSRGDYTTLVEAIEAAGPGDRIIVHAGRYVEKKFAIEKPVEIIGQGEPGDVLIHTSGTYGVEFLATRCRIENISLEVDSSWGLMIHYGRLVIESCDLKTTPWADSVTICISGNSNVVLQRNRIHGSHVGIILDEDATCTLDENHIYNIDECAISLNTFGEAILRGNHIESNTGTGIIITSIGRGTFEDNDLRGNKQTWDIKPECEARITRARNLE